MAEAVSSIKQKLDTSTVAHLDNFIEEYRNDERKSVIKLVETAQKRKQAYFDEIERLKEISKYEARLYSKGCVYVAGVDEVGRGPLAGPVAAAVVILKENDLIEGINDSKKLSAKKRDELYDIITERAVDWAVAMVSPEEIDEINILQATYKAMREALSKLKVKPDHLLADAVTIPLIDVEQTAIIKGDAKSISIGAASIIAKVTRDRMMAMYDELYPGYGFAENKGYGSAEHIKTIKEKGICPIHRKSFVKNFI
ncbi:MAG: ribonuclease HII [Firmicutes bacterium]|nr:ribonuclease HII [Bacillota bacterium]